jgi:UDP-N-acetyl-D-galactosamine dehydrogenase
VDVYDPWVDKEEEKKTYKSGIINDPFKSDKKYSAIIVAVAHDQFKTITNNSYQEISDGELILIDIKGIVEKPTWKL